MSLSKVSFRFLVHLRFLNSNGVPSISPGLACDEGAGLPWVPAEKPATPKGLHHAILIDFFSFAK
jgi:hypothetical protein